MRARKDLGALDEIELAELGSQTAVAMIRAAKERYDESAAQAEQLVSDANAAAERIQEEAKQDTERTIQQAVSRRDELLEVIARQRRWTLELLEDVDQVRGTTAEACTELRCLLDTAMSRLTGPQSRAEQLVTKPDHGSGRLDVRGREVVLLTEQRLGACDRERVGEAVTEVEAGRMPPRPEPSLQHRGVGHHQAGGPAAA